MTGQGGSMAQDGGEGTGTTTARGQGRQRRDEASHHLSTQDHRREQLLAGWEQVQLKTTGRRRQRAPRPGPGPGRWRTTMTTTTTTTTTTTSTMTLTTMQGTTRQ